MPTFNDINNRTGLLPIGPLPSMAPVAAFNTDQVESLLRTKGILAFHARHAVPYDTETMQAGKNLEQATERAMAYYDLRPLLVVPQSFSVNDTLTMLSLHATGTVVLNVTGEYLDVPERVFLRPRDLILMNPGMTDMHQERFEFKGKSQTIMHYKAKRVDYLACSSQGRMMQDVDFVVTDGGAIEFIAGQKIPRVGEVVSAVYEYSPIYSIRQVPHTLRVLPGNETGHGGKPRVAHYGPQYVVADRSVIRDDEYSIDWQAELDALDWTKWL